MCSGRLHIATALGSIDMYYPYPQSIAAFNFSSRFVFCGQHNLCMHVRIMIRQYMSSASGDTPKNVDSPQPHKKTRLKVGRWA